jgi:plasmid rolling circle replication initiator protein Rep
MTNTEIATALEDSIRQGRQEMMEDVQDALNVHLTIIQKNPTLAQEHKDILMKNVEVLQFNMAQLV